MMLSLPVRRFIADQEIFASSRRPEHPEISVVLPIYCHNGWLLERSILSVLAQRFTDFELIIVDDGSRDGSFNTAMRYAMRDSRIVVIRHELNAGLPAIRVNEGIMESRGKYIAYQFDDDEWLPNCLEDLHAEIVKHDEPCLVYGQTALMDESQNPAKTIRVLGEGPFNYALLQNSNKIANNSVLHHRSLCDFAGMYDPHVLMRRQCDYDLWLRYGSVVPFYPVQKQVANAYIAQEGSLGKSVPVASVLRMRRLMERPRNELLTPERILDYDIFAVQDKYITMLERDEIHRFEYIPFLTKLTYLLNRQELQSIGISRDKNKHITVIKSDSSTSLDVTFRNFLCRCDLLPYTYTFISSREWGYIGEHVSDMCVLYREVSAAGAEVLNYCKKNDIPAAYWIDDNMFRFSEDGPEYSFLKKGERAWDYLCQNISACDLTVSYSPFISSDARPYSSAIFELRTNIPSRYLAKQSTPAMERIHFAVFSGNVRKQIFGKLWEALSRFAREYADRIDITFFGLDPSEFGPLACPVYHTPFTYSYEQYLSRLQKSAFHFQICPLSIERNTDKSKSPVKFLEGLCAGAVALFSDVPPYNTLPEGTCLRTENSVESWYALLKQAFHMSPEERQTMFQRALSFVMDNYTTESQVIPFVTAVDLTHLLHHLQKRKIAYVAPGSTLSGATLHILQHMMLMHELGINTALYLPEGELGREKKGLPCLTEYVRKYGIEVKSISCRHVEQILSREERDMADGKKIAEIFKQENIGLICSAGYMPALGVAAALLSIPNVTTLLQCYPNSKFAGQKDVNIQIVHSISNRAALEYHKLLNIPAIRIVYPVGKEFFDGYEDNLKHVLDDFSKENPLHVLVSGTLHPCEGQLEAVWAVKMLQDKGIPVRLTVIGYDTFDPDYAATCYQAAAELQPESVTFVGEAEAPERFYRGNCHVLLCASTEEALPQSVLQGMAAGLFAVSTDCGGVSEIIKDNYNGILLPGNSPEILAEGLLRIAEMSAGRRLFMLKNAHDTISTIATPEFVRSELVNLYNRSFDEL